MNCIQNAKLGLRKWSQVILSTSMCMHANSWHSIAQRCYSHEVVEQEKKITLKDHLSKKIFLTGPISVAEFMKTALTYPDTGYYMQRDVFGVSGDFVTSPELSQMFGELIAVWLISEWKAHGSPNRVNIVEFGPGRGTLVDDILRTFTQLKTALKGTAPCIHLIEVSPALSKIQQETLCENKPSEVTGAGYIKGQSRSGIPICWHQTLDTVPRGDCSLFVAHEFFDALPVHKFVKDKGEWREIYVDTSSKPDEFRFILMPTSTAASKTLVKADEKRSHVEISPESALVCQSIASRLCESRGSALIGDYGEFGTTEDTLRAFKNHTQVDVLHNVGDCDITADVDFKYLHDNIDASLVTSSGPIAQRTFLQNMGIDTRLMMLLRHTTDDDVRRKLIGSYDVMTNPDKMGDRFKFFAFSSRDRSPESTRPTGFHNHVTT